jgi:hypothetical protein
MKKTGVKLSQEISYYARKLSPLKQLEALDFIKWLWGGPYAEAEEYTEEELDKLEKMAKKKGGVKFNNWHSAKKYLESLMP